MRVKIGIASKTVRQTAPEHCASEPSAAPNSRHILRPFYRNGQRAFAGAVSLWKIDPFAPDARVLNRTVEIWNPGVSPLASSRARRACRKFLAEEDMRKCRLRCAPL